MPPASEGRREAGRVLVIAGSDSGGGAGIQADIKSITMMGGYAATAITALTAQNTLGVADIHNVPTDFVIKQAETVLSDIGADIIKTGMLHNVEMIEAVAQIWADYDARGLVVDPVMVATSGDRLLHEDGADALRELLVPHAALLTPNMPEAEILTGRQVESLDDMKHAADALMNKGATAALIKGGHGAGAVVEDLLAMQSGFHVFESKRIESRHTHGTGCTLASAIAARLACGDTLMEATNRAIAYVQKAIETAPQLGRGHGPLNHRANADIEFS